MRLTISTIVSWSMDTSLVNSVICQVSSAHTPAIVINKTNKQIITVTTQHPYLDDTEYFNIS